MTVNAPPDNLDIIQWALDNGWERSTFTRFKHPGGPEVAYTDRVWVRKFRDGHKGHLIRDLRTALNAMREDFERWGD